MRRSFPAEVERRRSLLGRLDEAAGWINPFLMALATVLLITALTVGVARVLVRLPITYITAQPAVDDPPPHAVMTQPPR